MHSQNSPSHILIMLIATISRRATTTQHLQITAILRRKAIVHGTTANTEKSNRRAQHQDKRVKSVVRHVAEKFGKD